MLEARLELSIDPNQLPSLQAALERAGAALGDEPSLITSIYYDFCGIYLDAVMRRPPQAAGQQTEREPADP